MGAGSVVPRVACDITMMLRWRHGPYPNLSTVGSA
jgi:hypothetical protein